MRVKKGINYRVKNPMTPLDGARFVLGWPEIAPDVDPSLEMNVSAQKSVG